MADFKDFKDDFTHTFPDVDFTTIDALITLALEDDTDSKTLNGWDMSLSREKHDQLNYTYHISLSREDDKCCDEIELSFYTGIDVGCELEHYSLEGNSLADTPNMQRVLSGLKLDLNRMADNVSVNLAQQALDGYKDEIMDIYSKQGYDNYVTGGGTTKTDEHYKNAFAKYHNKGLFWICLFEEQEFDRKIA
jgi:hypothetical protein